MQSESVECSVPNFISKLGILEECNETSYWLELLSEANIIFIDQPTSLYIKN
jgi:hypothetical protein